MFGTLSDPMNRVSVVEIMATGMVEKNAQHVANLAASPCTGPRCLSHNSTSTALRLESRQSPQRGTIHLNTETKGDPPRRSPL